MPNKIVKEEVVLLLGDLHAGRKTATYSLRDVQERFVKLSKNVNTILDLHKSMSNIERLHIFCLGDMVQGENVLKQMMLEDLDATISEQRKSVIQGIEDFTASLKVDAWDMTCVAGNHGRTSKPSSTRANWDYILYEELQLKFGKNKVALPYSEYTTTKILDWGFLLNHGANIKSYLGLPYYGITSLALRWKQSIKDWDVLCMGHFHSLQELNFSGIPIFVNGTFVSDDEWPITTLGLTNDTRQWMFGVHKDRPISWRYGIELV